MLWRSLLVAAALSVAAGCRSGDSSPQRRTLIDSRDRYDPRSLDPALSTDVPTGRAVSYLFDGLTRFTVDAKLEPGLAQRWEVSPDGKVYTFHLRPGVHFQNGSALRARQVVHSFERVLNPATKGGRAWPLYPIAGARAYAEGKARAITGLAALDDSTLRITLDTALAIFPKLLAMPVASIVPDSTPADFGEHPVGTGPWRLAEWKHDDYILLSKNPTYWAGAPKSDSLMIRIIPEPSTAVAEFESGNVDLLYVPEAETQRWERTDEKKALLVSAPALRLWHGQDDTFARVAQSIQAYLGAVGVRVKILQRDNSSAREAARKGQTDLILKDWYADYPDAENFLYPLLHGANRGVGGNVSFYENPTFDRLVSQARVEQDDARRADLYKRADSLAFADAPMIYLFFYNELYAVQPWIKGFEVPTIFNGQRWTTVSIAGSEQQVAR